jgi:hypothetical protein
MRFNPAIEGRVSANWALACSPFGIEPIVDPTTWSILAGKRADFPPVPIRGLPANISAGLAAMQSALGTTYLSYFTLAEMLAYVGLLMSSDEIERELSPGDFVREKAPLFAALARQMMHLAKSFGVTYDRVRLVYGFDAVEPWQ